MTGSTPGADPGPRAEQRVALLDRLDHIDAARALWADDDATDVARDARDELDARVREAVATALTARQRALVELHFFQGLSQGEIARQLGVTQQVVQKQLYGVTRGGRRVGGALPRLREALRPLAGALGFARDDHGA